MIARISANGWRVPHGVEAQTYAPAPSASSSMEIANV
jgi:hypothetical protein